MAGTANISSSFVVTFNPSDTLETVITNPGRAFRVVGVAITNTTGAARNVKVEKDGTSNVTNGGDYSAADNTTSWADLDPANVEFTSANNLHITCANAGLEVYVLCVATQGGQTLDAATAP
jgi:hypothetical protein